MTSCQPLRRGRCAVLAIDATALAEAGTIFTQSANGVWLADGVPARYLRRLG
jgi:putative RNA 2'-phosphotransferase